METHRYIFGRWWKWGEIGQQNTSDNLPVQQMENSQGPYTELEKNAHEK